MDRIYMNRIDGEQRIHIEIASNEVSDVLDDLADDPEHFDATRRLLEILRTAEEIFCPTVSETRRNRDAARQATGQPACVHPEGYEGECPCTTGCDCCKATARAVDCPACDAGIVHTEHCPTPETHNWGCGCPTDQMPAGGPL